MSDNDRYTITQSSAEIDNLPINIKNVIIEALQIAMDATPSEKHRQQFNAVLMTLTARQTGLPGF